VAFCDYTRPRRPPVTAAPFAVNDTVLALAGEAFTRHHKGQRLEAITLYERILCLNDLPVIRNSLGQLLAESGRHNDALVHYERAAALDPSYADALCNWGSSLSHLDRLDEAEAKLRSAIAADPNFAHAHHNLAVVLKETGRIDEAVRQARRAIRLAPQNPSYYENLAAVRKFTPRCRYLAALERLAQGRASLSIDDQIALHFTLAKAYEDTGKPDAGFEQMLKGNQLKRQQVAYDEDDMLARMTRTRELFSADFVGARQGAGDPSPIPIFIVGMPRSGTTLVEQILSSHPDVFGAGEINWLDQAAGALAKAIPGSQPFLDKVTALSGEHFAALGSSYLDRLKSAAPHALRIVDKMPGNFLFAGLIHLALPNAAIIHLIRDPVDTCVSCFSANFVNQPQTHDLAELGRYYRHYDELMAHWRRVLPLGRILDVRYEQLVGDLQTSARRMIAHCGLTWDSRCLDFHRNPRPVRTASAAQVRRSIYRSSVGRWRNYEKFLGPLLAELPNLQ
jgi:Flp pilus assembly protein TadD